MQAWFLRKGRGLLLEVLRKFNCDIFGQLSVAHASLV